MAASDNLNQKQFKMSTMQFDNGQLINAHTGNGRILGALTTKNGMISNVVVKEKWQHQGMATQMFAKAREHEPNLSHSGNRTDAGNGWAKKVGGPLPPRMQDG